jgi:hypothetical protein
MSKPSPARYRTTNWSGYNASLRKRGALLIWVHKDMIWRAPRDGRPGRPPVFSDAAIQFCLSIKVLFKLPLRQTAGMVASLLKLAGLDWPVPDFSTLCRRQKTLAVQVPYRRADGPLNLLVDSTGIKFLGDGEWQARKHGVQGRRQWRKVHLAMDPATSDIRAVEFTPSRDGDSPVLPDLLGQIPDDEPIGTVTADGALGSARSGLKRSPGPFPGRPSPRAAATRPSSSAMQFRSSRSERTGGSGRMTAQRPAPETRPCARRDITAGPSGNAGRATMPAAASRRRCAASRPSGNASPRETPTARPPKSTSASPS